MLEDENFQSADVFMLPPDYHDKSDEDSGPEDDDGTISNLTGEQLRVTAEAKIILPDMICKRIGCLDDDNDSEDDNDVKYSMIKKRKISDGANRKSISHSHRQWKKVDLKPSDSPWGKIASELQNVDYTPLKIFQLFFDEEVVEHVTRMSKLYASQKLKNLSATCSDIELTIAILLLSGHVPLPNRRMYLENSEDVCNDAVCSCMSLNRFKELLRFLHVADNEHLDKSDKFAKL